MEELAGEIEFFELATFPGYDRLFTDSLRFPEPPAPPENAACCVVNQPVSRYNCPADPHDRQSHRRGT
jgi:hypothetical protein